MLSTCLGCATSRALSRRRNVSALLSPVLDNLNHRASHRKVTGLRRGVSVGECVFRYLPRKQHQNILYTPATTPASGRFALTDHQPKFYSHFTVVQVSLCHGHTCIAVERMQGSVFSRSVNGFRFERILGSSAGLALRCPTLLRDSEVTLFFTFLGDSRAYFASFSPDTCQFQS